MENKFNSLTIFEFHERLPGYDACFEYLVELKWGIGFECPHCGPKKYCNAKYKYHRQYIRCNRKVSPASQTVFHKLKFPILKAFYIAYYMSTDKKGICSTEFIRKLGLWQKTCWSFKHKVMKVMESSGTYKINDKAEVDETIVSGQEEVVKRHKNNNKKLVIFDIEKKEKGVSCMYGKVIRQISSKELGAFMGAVLDRHAQIKTDKWKGYQPLKKVFGNLVQVESGKKGGNFPELHRTIMGFKGWLKGMNHKIIHLQCYIDEYCEWFNRYFMKEGIFENLLLRMVLLNLRHTNNLSLKCLIQ